MKRTLTFGACVLVAATFSCATQAQEPLDQRRLQPIVQAVAKTVPSVVTIQVPQPETKDRIGAGFVFDERGYILTCRHVTAGKRYVNVRLNSHIAKAEVVVADADLDLAVLRIDHDKALPALRFGIKDDLLLGETVITVGSPYGYEKSVAAGIVSAKTRSVKMPNGVLMKDLIQHTAAINPGNSGGPLVNGDVVGINVAMKEDAEHVAFAINAGVILQFLTKNFNARKLAGIDHGLNCEDTVSLQPVRRPVVVVKYAAYEALKTGDAVTMIGGLKIVNTFDVERAFWEAKPGQKVEVKILRQGKDLVVPLTLRPAEGVAPAPGGPAPPAGSAPSNPCPSARPRAFLPWR